MTELAPLPNYTDMFAQSFQTGREMARQKGVQNALSMAPTDPTAAAAELTKYGEFQGANALMQNAASQRALKTQQTVAPQIAAGDYGGAARTAAAGGQFDMAGQIGKLDEAQRQHAADTADVVARAAYGLSQLPQEQRAQGLAKLAPMLQARGVAPEQLQNLDLSDQGLATVAQQAMSLKDTIASHQKDTELQNTAEHNKATEALTAQEQKQTAAYHQAELNQGQQRLGIEANQAQRAAWQVLNDPKTGVQYRYNAATGASTTMDGSQPYAPQGAGKIASGSVRSAPAMATQRFLEEHPTATAEDLSAFNANLAKQRAAAVAFGTGKQGQTVNSLNVAVQHLDTLGQLADAMGNGNIPLINKVGQAWTQQTGGPAPTNFNAAKQIVADEVVKAVVGSGGGVGDRDKAQQAIMSTNSPAQLKGAIQTYTKLMGGQLGGLKLQYKNSTGLDDFETHLAPSTQAALESHAAAGNRPPLSSIFGH